MALASEIIYGAPFRFSDPARFSMAHGGKDGHPFPVSVDVYDHTIGALRQALGLLGRRLENVAHEINQVVGCPPW